MIVSVNVEKAVDQIQHLLMKKLSWQTKNRRKHLQLDLGHP